jgi:succinyl-diaminopimelate desuccinylase
VSLANPHVTRLREAGQFPVEPKQAWTNVADFAGRGLDAVNFGPGATRYAHAADERVEIAELERCYDTLRRFLAGTV